MDIGQVNGPQSRGKLFVCDMIKIEKVLGKWLVFMEIGSVNDPLVSDHGWQDTMQQLYDGGQTARYSLVAVPPTTKTVAIEEFSD